MESGKSCSATGRDNCNNRKQSTLHDEGLWAIRFALRRHSCFERADARPAANASSIIASGRSCFESVLEANDVTMTGGIVARSHEESRTMHQR